jgi:hypothetical protein
MYTLKLAYPSHYSQILKETHTHASLLKLYCLNVHCCQSSATRLVFDTDQDRTYAILLLSNSLHYTAVCE